MIIKDFHFSFENGPHLIDSVSITVDLQKVSVMMAPSGSGKTTFLRSLLGIAAGHAKGNITDERLGLEMNVDGLRSSTIRTSLVPQTPMLLPWKTVRENIALGSLASHGSALSIEIDQLLETVGLAQASNLYPAEISHGMASRVSFARAVAARPHYIFLDEPFASLDAITRIHLQDWFMQQVKALNIGALFVTHDIHEAIKIGDRIDVLAGKPLKNKISFYRGQATADTLLAALENHQSSLNYSKSFR